MDRNIALFDFPIVPVVALRKESVDRNGLGDRRKNRASQVALRKESVDRNYVISIARMVPRTSLSARRAWIEIDTRFSIEKYRKSLSARRAWIEI